MTWLKFIYVLVCPRLRKSELVSSRSMIMALPALPFNPHLPSELFHPYQMDESISSLRGV